MKPFKRNVKKHKKLLAFVLFSIIYVCSSYADFYAKVTNVIDGDTFDVVNNDSDTIRVRLWGVDCPEYNIKRNPTLNQPFGKEAKLFVDTIFKKGNGRVIIKLVSNTKKNLKNCKRYHFSNDRLVAEVTVRGKNLGIELLRNGLAWIDPRYCCPNDSNNHSYYDALKVAKNTNICIWSEDNPIPPWEFRKNSSYSDQTKNEALNKKFSENNNPQ